MKVTDQSIVTIWKVIHKEGAGKIGYNTWLVWTVTLILDNLVNDMPPAATSPNIVPQAALDMPRVKVIVQDIPRISFIWSCQMILQIIGKTLAYYRIGR